MPTHQVVVIAELHVREQNSLRGARRNQFHRAAQVVLRTLHPALPILAPLACEEPETAAPTVDVAPLPTVGRWSSQMLG